MEVREIYRTSISEGGRAQCRILSSLVVISRQLNLNPFSQLQKGSPARGKKADVLKSNDEVLIFLCLFIPMRYCMMQPTSWIKIGGL